MPSLVDGYMVKLNIAGFTSGTINDRLFALLRFKGGTGSYASMQKQKRTSGRVSYVFDPNEVP
jgi:hypothetical protein